MFIYINIIFKHLLLLNRLIVCESSLEGRNDKFYIHVLGRMRKNDAWPYIHSVKKLSTAKFVAKFFEAQLCNVTKPYK